MKMYVISTSNLHSEVQGRSKKKILYWLQPWGRKLSIKP